MSAAQSVRSVTLQSVDDLSALRLDENPTMVRVTDTCDPVLLQRLHEEKQLHCLSRTDHIFVNDALFREHPKVDDIGNVLSVSVVVLYTNVWTVVVKPRMPGSGDLVSADTDGLNSKDISKYVEPSGFLRHSEDFKSAAERLLFENTGIRVAKERLSPLFLDRWGGAQLQVAGVQWPVRSRVFYVTVNEADSLLLSNFSLLRDPSRMIVSYRSGAEIGVFSVEHCIASDILWPHSLFLVEYVHRSFFRTARHNPRHDHPHERKTYEPSSSPSTSSAQSQLHSKQPVCCTPRIPATADLVKCGCDPGSDTAVLMRTPVPGYDFAS